MKAGAGYWAARPAAAGIRTHGQATAAQPSLPPDESVAAEAALTAQAAVPVITPVVLQDCSTSWSGGAGSGSGLRAPQPLP